jgi:hypothetical protein
MVNQALITKIPNNTNFLQTAKFVFEIVNLPFAKYFCQTVLIPGVSTAAAIVETPTLTTYRHGDKAVFDPLTITFLVDEDMKTWEETFKWMVSLTTPESYSQYATFRSPGGSLYFDGILTLNTNSNIGNYRLLFKNCHPTSLGTIQLATNDSADITPICDLTFQYDSFVFERL